MELYIPPVLDRDKKGRFVKGHNGLPEGYRHSPEVLERMSRVHRGNPGKPPVYKGKPVVAIKDGKLLTVFPGAAAVARHFGVCRGIISRVCRGERNSYRGIRFFYEDDPQWLKLITP